MSHMKKTWTNTQVETIVGSLLRGGVITAATLVLTGGILYLARHGSELPEYKAFAGEPSDLRSVWGIITDTISLHSRGIIQFGLLLLMFTPVARVAFLCIAFSRQRDISYIFVTVIVLTVLLFSLIGHYL